MTRSWKYRRRGCWFWRQAVLVSWWIMSSEPRAACACSLLHGKFPSTSAILLRTHWNVIAAFAVHGIEPTGVEVLLLFLVTCILIVWRNAGSVHARRHLANSRCNNLWHGVIPNAWLNFPEGVGKSWNAWDTSRVGTAYIRHGVAADQERHQRLENYQRSESEHRRASESERGKKKCVLCTSLCRQLWLCHRHLESSWICSLLIEIYCEIVWNSQNFHRCYPRYCTAVNDI